MCLVCRKGREDHGILVDSELSSKYGITLFFKFKIELMAKELSILGMDRLSENSKAIPSMVS